MDAQKDETPPQIIDRIKTLVESDENLTFGHALDLKEISKPNKCVRVFRATVTITAKVDL